MKTLLPLVLLLAAGPAVAEVLPRLDQANPRLQSVRYVSGERVLLTAVPGSGLVVMFEPGEQVERVTLGGNQFDVRVSIEGDSLTLLPGNENASGTLAITTDRRSYQFTLQTGTGLTAAYVVRFDYGAAAMPVAADPGPFDADSASSSYRMRGDREVRPDAITDDGAKTYIAFDPAQALPAVLAIGPSGEEQVVDGFMRGKFFVIDRVYKQLVFRIDRKRAVATREAKTERRP